MPKLSKDQRNVIAAQSRARAYSFTLVLSVLRELRLSYMDTAVFGDKKILNQSFKNIDKMFKHFDGDGWSDLKIFDDMSGELISLIDDYREAVERIMLEEIGLDYDNLPELPKGVDTTELVQESEEEA